MITTYSKVSGEYYNHYGQADDWKIEHNEIKNKWDLFAKEATADEWVHIARTQKEEQCEKQKTERIADYDLLLKVKNTDTHQVV